MKNEKNNGNRHQDLLQAKLCDWPRLEAKLNAWRLDGARVVFTNGCFDLLHLGHIDYLTKTADLGDKLIVAVNTDASVRKLKGANRPIQDEQSRARPLAALEAIDAVILFDEDSPLHLITQIKPDVLVKGGDYTIDTIVGSDVVLNAGGKVEVIPFLDGYSTTAIEQKIKG